MGKETESIGELIDKLSITNIKMNKWNHRKIELHKKKLTLEEKDELIRIDKQVMITNEMRVALKNEITRRIEGGIKEERTYVYE